MEFHRQQRFSIRKYAVGVASVLIGMVLMGSVVSADTVTPAPSTVESSAVVPDNTVTDEKGIEPNTVTKEDTPASPIEEVPSTVHVPAETDGKDQTKQPQTTSSATSDPSNEKPKEEKTLSASVMASPTANPELATKDTPKEVAKETLEDSSPVEVLVRLKEKVSDGVGESSPVSKEARIEQTNQDHEQFLKELERQSIQFKKLYDVNLLFNGLALETTYGDAKKIRGLARVDALDYAPLGRTRVAENQLTPASPASTTTKVSEENSLINLQPLWDKGIKGLASDLSNIINRA